MKRFALVLLIFFLAGSGSAFARGDYYRVLYASDGDTLMLERHGKKIKVRLIGIDTPEKHDSDKLFDDAERSGQDVHTIRGLGKRSGRFTQKLVEGRLVRLEYDVTRFDRHGRTLAYVFFTMDENEFAEKTGKFSSSKKKKSQPREYFLNRVLVEYGYALAYTRFPFIYEKEFVKLQQWAREENLGLWKPDSKQRHLQEIPNGK